jgi:hypothetical protein
MNFPFLCLLLLHFSFCAATYSRYLGQAYEKVYKKHIPPALGRDQVSNMLRNGILRSKTLHETSILPMLPEVIPTVIVKDSVSTHLILNDYNLVAFPYGGPGSMSVAGFISMIRKLTELTKQTRLPANHQSSVEFNKFMAQVLTKKGILFKPDYIQVVDAWIAFLVVNEHNMQLQNIFKRRYIDTYMGVIGWIDNVAFAASHYQVETLTILLNALNNHVRFSGRVQNFITVGEFDDNSNDKPLLINMVKYKPEHVKVLVESLHRITSDGNEKNDGRCQVLQMVLNNGQLTSLLVKYFGSEDAWKKSELHRNSKNIMDDCSKKSK